MRIVHTALVAACVATSSPAVPAAVINVSNVESLYDAVNNPANAGATVVLAPGHYALTKLDPLDAPRPNGGRLELQANMSLVGVTGHPEDVVIDSSHPTSGPAFGLAPMVSAGTIRIGRGRDRVEWLTVVGGTASAAGVQTDLVGAAAPSVRIAHVVARGSARGIDVRNLRPASAGRTLTVDLDDNEVFANTAGNGQGFRFVNSTDADGASIVASLHGNRSHDNKTGFLAANQAASHASITIDSHDDAFDDNAVGGIVFGGITQVLPAGGTVAHGNSVTITIHGGSFANNAGASPPENGGLSITGGLAAVSGSTSNNTVRVSIWGARFENNLSTDVNAWGARTNAALPAGVNNVVAVDLHGVSARAVTAATDSVPAEPAGTNRARL